MNHPGHRDIATSNDLTTSDAPRGRMCIAVIGIDRYRGWHRLHNAVNDARGIQRLFLRLGFEPVATPLFDDMATGDALRRLATDDLAALGPDDSLVLFFAGHGHTVTRTYSGGASVKDGYIIPVDGAAPGRGTGSWLRLDSWLADVTRSPAKHILVVLDACHSGIALGPIIRWRGDGVELPRKEPLSDLRTRRSRRIITSALDDQRALDAGPVPGHSLFTGCIIEGLTGGVATSTGRGLVTGSELGQYVQRRVAEYPGSVQTPDFGSLELDDRGELVVNVEAGSPTSTDLSALLSRRTPTAIVAQPEPARRSTARGPIATALIVLVFAAGGAVLATVLLPDRMQDATAGSASPSLSGTPASSVIATVVVDAGSLTIGDGLPDAPEPVHTSPSTAADAADAGVATTPVAEPPAITLPLPARKQPKRITSRPGATTPPVSPSMEVPSEQPPGSGSGSGSAVSPGVSNEVTQGQCSKSVFAAVYEAAVPAPGAARAALGMLKKCRDDGFVTDAEFDRYQAALVAKL